MGRLRCQPFWLGHGAAVMSAFGQADVIDPRDKGPAELIDGRLQIACCEQWIDYPEPGAPTSCPSCKSIFEVTLPVFHGTVGRHVCDCEHVSHFDAANVTDHGYADDDTVAVYTSPEGSFHICQRCIDHHDPRHWLEVIDQPTGP